MLPADEAVDLPRAATYGYIGFPFCVHHVCFSLNEGKTVKWTKYSLVTLCTSPLPPCMPFHSLSRAPSVTCGLWERFSQYVGNAVRHLQEL